MFVFNAMSRFYLPGVFLANRSDRVENSSMEGCMWL